MKNIYLILIIIPALLFSCSEKSAKTETTNPPGDTPGYDSTLAARYGADEFGMKQYVIAFLMEGPNRDQDEKTVEELQNAHLKNIMKMADEGKVVVAGPFMDEWEARGIYIFNTSSLDSAAIWTSSDPAIKAGRLVMDLHPWYGSAALMQVNETHHKISRESIAD